MPIARIAARRRRGRRGRHEREHPPGDAVHAGAYVSREGAGLRILEAGPGNPFQPGTRRFAYYFDCRDVDGLYAELKPKLDLLPAHDVHGPEDKHYGQRELLVLAPDGNLIAFGQAVPSKDD